MVRRPRRLQLYGRARRELAQELEPLDIYWDDAHLIAPVVDNRPHRHPYNLRPRRIIALTINGNLVYYYNRLDDNHRPIITNGRR